MLPQASSISFKSIMIILCFFVGVGALTFDVSPTSISPGKQLIVTWTPSPSGDNPDTFALSIKCDTMGNTDLLDPTPLVTAASLLPLPIPDIFPIFQAPAQCHLVVTTILDPSDLLEPIPTASFTINPRPGSTISENQSPHQSTTRVQPTRSSADIPTNPESPSSTTSTTSTTQTSKSSTTLNSVSPPTISLTDASSSLSSEESSTTLSNSTSSVSSESTRTSALPLVIISTDASSSDGNPTPTSSSTSHHDSTTKSTQTSMIPIGAIVGGVVGGLIGLILVILFIIALRRRRTRSRSPPTPVPLPHDRNYVQPMEKNSRLAQITIDREAAQRQRDQVQTEVDSRESAYEGSSSSGDSPSGSGPREQQIEVLLRRIRELEAQRQDLGHNLYNGLPPPSYSN